METNSCSHLRHELVHSVWFISGSGVIIGTGLPQDILHIHTCKHLSVLSFKHMQSLNSLKQAGPPTVCQSCPF